MFGASVRRLVDATPSRRLFDAIGDFLVQNRLDFDPVNYAFAHRVVSQPGGPLARTVATLTDGGVRLSARDIHALGGEVVAGVPDPCEGIEDEAAALAERTQQQVAGFADMVDAMRAETQDFGRDLAASAVAMREIGGSATPAAAIRLTAAMLDRVHSAETRLEAATREASVLREELEAARGDARRDSLTGLPNRRGFVEGFDERGARGCLAICDIDHFKEVNDRFGHAVGDRVLKAIGDSLAQGCGAHLVARYGGEEFAILFDGLARDAALTLLDRVRAQVAAKRYRLRENAESLGAVTFSAGLVELTAGEGFPAAFQRADALLYAAKSSGRNIIHHD